MVILPIIFTVWSMKNFFINAWAQYQVLVESPNPTKPEKSKSKSEKPDEARARTLCFKPWSIKCENNDKINNYLEQEQKSFAKCLEVVDIIETRTNLDVFEQRHAKNTVNRMFLWRILGMLRLVQDLTWRWTWWEIREDKYWARLEKP